MVTFQRLNLEQRIAQREECELELQLVNYLVPLVFNLDNRAAPGYEMGGATSTLSLIRSGEYVRE